MRVQNDGISEDNVLHNQFTAYLIKSLRNRRIRYLRQMHMLQIHELSLEPDLHIDELISGDDLLTGLPVIDILENYRLQKALYHTKECDLLILFARVLYGQSFSEIAHDLGIKQNTVVSIYYRLIERLKTELRGDRE